MPARTEVLGDGAIGGKKPLRLTGGFELLHLPLALPGGLVRVFRTIVEISVLAMFYPREDLPLGSSIALQFVGHDHPRYVAQPLEELTKELLRGPFITSPLDQNVEHVPFLIDCPPQMVMFALNSEDHFIEMPSVTRPRTPATELRSIPLAELATP